MTIELVFDHHASNVITYLLDKYKLTHGELIIKALNEYYAEDIKELEREEE